jgi:hypothetical protein
MAKRTFKAGATSQTMDIFVADSSSIVGAGLSGLAFGTSGLTCYYRVGATGTATAISLATQTVGGAWATGGFKEIDATNMKGVYRFDIPNAVLATAPYAVVYFYGATNMVPVVAELEIVSYDPFNVTAERTAMANAFLDQDMSTGTDSGTTSIRTVRQALRFLRNKWSVNSGSLTVCKEDDTTASWTASIGTTAGTTPITSVDPA